MKPRRKERKQKLFPAGFHVFYESGSVCPIFRTLESQFELLPILQRFLHQSLNVKSRFRLLNF